MSALNLTGSSLNPDAPVVIGGVGGSGTRLVAKIFMEAGVFLGSDLNLENDNLWFTLLFRRPHWYRKVAGRKDRRIFTGLRVFAKAMLGSGALTVNELAFATRVAAKMSLEIHAANKATRGLWPFQRVQNMRRAARRRLEKSYRGWGWKEPNSHIYLPHLFQQFPAVRYIHVIRHGLDMAFSINQVQLYNWSFLFGLKPPKTKLEVPAASLKYWVRANQRAIDFGKTLGPDHFLAVNFDQLCFSTSSEIKRILDFAGAKVSKEGFSRLCQLPQPQKSSGRYLRRECNVFDRHDVEAVRRFGFDVKI
jgi:hypothetical protein